MATSTEQSTMIKNVEEAVKTYMRPFDASHDFNHIRRVVKQAHHLYKIESIAHPEIPYEWHTIHLAALIHDVGDHKYKQPGQTDDELMMAGEILLISKGVDASLARVAQVIGNGVSYTAECRDPELLQSLIKQHPELAIVQDADRLDALGAVGIARTFTFNGANPRSEGTMQSAIMHVKDKLIRLPGMMKTEEGKRIAELRWSVVQGFLEHWEEEVSMNGDRAQKMD